MRSVEKIRNTIEVLNKTINTLEKQGEFIGMGTVADSLCLSKNWLTQLSYTARISIELAKYLASIQNIEVSKDTSEAQLFQRIDGLISEVDKKMLLNQEEKCEEYPSTISVQVKDDVAKKLLMEKIDAIDCLTLGSYFEARALSLQLIAISNRVQDREEILETLETTPVDELPSQFIGSTSLPEMFKADCLADLAKFDIYF